MDTNDGLLPPDVPPPDGQPDAPSLLDGPHDAPPDVPPPDVQPPDDFCKGSDVVLSQKLLGATSGQRSGGTFTGDGWKTSTTGDQIYWDLGQAVPTGSIEFDMQGFFGDVPGCLAGVCYYFGIFEDSSGDKKGDYSGSAFIESRFHTNNQENFHDTLKLQSGTGASDMSELLIDWPVVALKWDPNDWHSFRIEWGNGKAHLYVDGVKKVTTVYGSRPSIDWRHLFIGTTNYKKMGWAAKGITYRRLCLRK